MNKQFFLKGRHSGTVYFCDLPGIWGQCARILFLPSSGKLPKKGGDLEETHSVSIKIRLYWKQGQWLKLALGFFKARWRGMREHWSGGWKLLPREGTWAQISKYIQITLGQVVDCFWKKIWVIWIIFSISHFTYGVNMVYILVEDEFNVLFFFHKYFPVVFLPFDLGLLLPVLMGKGPHGLGSSWAPVTANSFPPLKLSPRHVELASTCFSVTIDNWYF